MKEHLNVVGLMSGTSLDGVDLAMCRIGGLECRVLKAATIPYSDFWLQRLSDVEHASAFEYVKTHVELGHHFGRLIKGFLSDSGIVADAVASHGHTVFHQPGIGVTAQIGDGNAIAAETGLPVVCDFRSLDVALGGQGAPLVPIGDELLFGQHDACLNLGGIANVSFRENGRRVAYDICPCNMALNYLSRQLGMPYDRDGLHSRAGRVEAPLLASLGELHYYSADYPKSLGKEWFVKSFLPLLVQSSSSVEDKLATCVEHIVDQVAASVRMCGAGDVLVTGGGAHNAYLIERLRAVLPSVRVVVPEDTVVDYKEAMIFAYLGYLRLTGKTNTLSSVTGARADSCGGVLCGGFKQ